MKKNIVGLTFLLIITGFSIQNRQRPFQRLYGLEGTWKMNGKRGAFFEEWIRVDNNYLQSRSYFIKNGDTVITERVKLTNTRVGIFYTPVVEDQNNRQPVEFKMTKVEKNRFVFENPEHDFPKRIVYNLVTADSLHAYVDDGTDIGKKQHFYYKRQ